MATPSTWSKIFPSKQKCVCEVAKRNNVVNSFSENNKDIFILRPDKGNGVVMGSLLVPALINLFIGYNE